MYEFKWAELWWAIGIAALTVLGSSLAFQEVPNDWRAWSVGLGVGIARAVVAAALNEFRRMTSERGQSTLMIVALVAVIAVCAVWLFGPITLGR